MFILYDVETNEIIQQSDCPGNLGELQMAYSEIFPERKLVIKQVA